MTNVSFHGHPQLEAKVGPEQILVMQRLQKQLFPIQIFRFFSFTYLEMVEKDYESIPRQKEEGNSTDPGEDDVQHSVVGGTQFICVNYSI